MPEVLEPVGIETGQAAPLDTGERDGATGRFLVGHKGMGGRPAGVPNTATLYLNALPRKARQWIKSESPQILSEARALVGKSDDRVSLPSDKLVAGGSSPTLTIVIVEQLRNATSPSTRMEVSDAGALPVALPSP